ncbi:MAG: tetratricopeptide repeat protein [Chloroflexi bacterium]|nr:tetratricopeptide repeat protein [Chloroflexota bacterium]
MSTSALRLFEEALTHAREDGSSRAIASVLGNLGGANWSFGRLDVARAYFEEALTRFRELNASVEAAGVLANLGMLANRQVDPATDGRDAPRRRYRPPRGDLRAARTGGPPTVRGDPSQRLPYVRRSGVHERLRRRSSDGPGLRDQNSHPGRSRVGTEPRRHKDTKVHQDGQEVTSPIVLGGPSCLRGWVLSQLLASSLLLR